MKRRHFLSRSIALATMLSGSFARAASKSLVKPGTVGWPTDAEWDDLNRAVNGHLSPVGLPDLDDPAVRRLTHDPFYLGDHPGLTQSSGWLDAWRSAPSAYVVAAESAADVAATLRFARVHRLPLVVRGGGHSYTGGSNAAGSLLIWTRHLNAISIHSAFRPVGSYTQKLVTG
jgi:FAD binding domain